MFQDFVACAMTPGGGLFQLGISQNLGYAVFRIDEDGEMHLRRGGDYPSPTRDRIGALESFRKWAERQGYEYVKNENAVEPKRYKATIVVFRTGSVDIYLDAANPEAAKVAAAKRFRHHMKMKPDKITIEEVEPK